MAHANDAGLHDSEDALGFAAPAEPHATAAEGEPRGASDESDDLFDFDELGAERDRVEETVDIDEIMGELPDDVGDDVGGDAGDEPTAEAEESPSPVAAELLPHAAPAEAKRIDASKRAPAAARPASRVPAPLQPVAATLSWRSPLTLILVGVMLLNVGLVGLTLKLNTASRQQFEDRAGEVLRAAQDLQSRTGQQFDRIERIQRPLVAAAPEGAETLDLARAEIATGDFADARLRLYALLAVSGRLDRSVRDDVVAQARFLLADGLAAQAAAAAKGADR